MNEIYATHSQLSRKFDEFNVMPVELLDGQRLHVVMDFAPLLNPSAARARAPSATATAGTAGDEGFTPTAAWLLGGAGLEGRKQRRIGVLLPKESLVSDLKSKNTKPSYFTSSFFLFYIAFVTSVNFV